uniref:peptidylprolyl isomerase n=1 Tax=Saccoglossus kowalevskii TaxID=10224 RepID=A0ABM0GVE3_SACKO|nr:PREDICTED: peptidyl-prolyl cis-trans isomerase FKBP15-2-like [Saccoglossus kowalevskii]
MVVVAVILFVSTIFACSTVNGASNVFELDGVTIERTHIPKTCDFAAEDGDTLSIHYRGTLEDKTEFDSSYNRNRPFSFTLGEGQVIKGWDIGIKDMCIGEKRTLTIPSDKGYGDRGSPPKIPGGATLIFETELLDID